MNLYSFEYPLAIFLLIPILACLYKCREMAVPKYFVHLHLLHAKKDFLKIDWILKILTFIFLCITLASPLIVDRLNPLNRIGKDIVLALDASGSMNSSGFVSSVDDLDIELEEGVSPTRFELTKAIAQKFILERSLDNVGVVLYGDYAFIASPITYEKEIVAQMLGFLTQGMAGQNTAIGEAIAMSVRAFDHSHAKSKVLVLLSDGEHNSGAIAPKEAVKLAVAKGIKIYTIAIGNKNEADTALLEHIANEAGGAFYFAEDAKKLEEVYEKIDALESSKIKSREYLTKELFFSVPLALALALMFVLMVRGLRR